MKPARSWQYMTKGMVGAALSAAILAACSTAVPGAPSAPGLGVAITNLKDGDTVDFSNITVSCEVGSAVTRASYSLNGGEPVEMAFSGRNYDFSVEGLVPGPNTLELTVDDDDPATRGVTVEIEINFGGGGAKAHNFIALTDHNTLVAFGPADPGEATVVALKGLKGTLLGVDYRPADGRLYGLDTSNTLYTIDPETGAARRVSTLSVPFKGGISSGFDFNPVADRLRLTGLNDQNFRVNVDTGEVTQDRTLSFRQGDRNEGVSPTVTASAYRNSVADASKTALYGLDAKRNVLVLQDPPNDGTLATIGRRELGFNVDEVAGFDIVTDSSENGRDTSDTGYVLSESRFYTVGLTDGRSKRLGELPEDTYIGLTAVINDPERTDDTPRDMVALGDDNTLVLFNTSSPDETVEREVRGVRGTLSGIDYRPANGLLYGIDTSNSLYVIDTLTGAAAEVSRLDTIFSGGGRSGIDFNPVVDRLRLTSTGDQNLRVNADTGEVVTDGKLAYAAGDPNRRRNPSITASAYRNAFAGATVTELYGIDAKLNVLVEQNPPNDGVLVTTGKLGFDISDEAGFDIVTDDPSDEGSNVGYVLSDDDLYKVNLETGATTRVGTVPGGPYRGLAVVP